MTNICHYAHERIEPRLQLNWDPPSLQTLEGSYKGQHCVEGFTNMLFIRGHQPFGSHSRHAICTNVCSGYVNMFTECVINGALFSLWMNSGLASKVIVSIFSFEENLELVFMCDTFVKEIHTNQAVSVFGVVSIWVDAQTSMSFPLEMLIEMTSWMLMCDLMPRQ
ncbi:hypothetical protein TNCV_4550561 [Trichonephila clavipes]|nr:hypothetical protein TNCV_4550561 [Trichonephila clavipes]